MFTDHVYITREGNVFTSVCDSVLVPTLRPDLARGRGRITLVPTPFPARVTTGAVVGIAS